MYCLFFTHIRSAVGEGEVWAGQSEAGQGEARWDAGTELWSGREMFKLVACFKWMAESF